MTDSQSTPTDPLEGGTLGNPRAATKSPRRTRRTVVVRVGAVLLAIIIGVVGYRLFFARSDPATAKVGDCVSIKGSASVATATRLACDDPHALYVVTATGLLTCDTHEVNYTGGNRDRTRLCLFYNVTAGDCLTPTQGGESHAKGTCVKGAAKVVSVRTDTSSVSECPPDADMALPDDTRNRLICLATLR